MFQIDLTPEAMEDLEQLRKYDQRTIIAAIEIQLTQQPNLQTRNRKRIRPNQLAEWELRIGRFRVFYDCLPDDKVTRIIAIGYKEGSKLFIHGQEFEL